MRTYLTYILIVLFTAFLYSCDGNETELPRRGICAHRGENHTNPENTLSAFKAAVSLGAHMIEFDVRMTKDGYLVIMHDKTVDRTTNGKGLVSEYTLKQIKELDAGSWKSERFKGEKVPLLSEVLDVIPGNIWINVHLKGDAKLGEETAKMLIEKRHTHHAFISCNNEVLQGVKRVDGNIMTCNMERLKNRSEYVDSTISRGFRFIQLLKKRKDENFAGDVKRLREHGIMVSYYHAETAEEVTELFNSGVNFILTNSLEDMLNVADSLGIKPNKQGKR